MHKTLNPFTVIKITVCETNSIPALYFCGMPIWPYLYLFKIIVGDWIWKTLIYTVLISNNERWSSFTRQMLASVNYVANFQSLLCAKEKLNRPFELYWDERFNKFDKHHKAITNQISCFTLTSLCPGAPSRHHCVLEYNAEEQYKCRQLLPFLTSDFKR